MAAVTPGKPTGGPKNVEVPSGPFRPGVPQVGQGPGPAYGPQGPNMDPRGYKKPVGAQPENHGRGFWTTPRTTLGFAASALPGVVALATWSSPIFDLRPDLGYVGMGNYPQNAQPIWKTDAFGAGLNLYLQVDGPIQTIADELQVDYSQSGNIMHGSIADVNRLEQLQEITSDFFDGANTVIIQWPVPGYRFWQVQVIWTQRSGNVGSIPQLWTSAAIY